MNRVCLWLMAALIVLSAASCGRRASRGPKVAFVSNTVSDFWTIAKAGVEAGERDFGVDCDFRLCAQGSAADQRQILEDLVVKGVKGIAISPIDPANQTGLFNKLSESVDIICMDSDAPDSKRLCYVGTDNYKAGRAAGEEMKNALPNGGEVVLFVGTLDALNARQRRQGILDVCKGSNVRVIDTLLDNTIRAKAKSNVEDTLVAHPDVAGLMGLWSYNGPAIAGAVKAAGKQGKVKIVTFDEEDGTLQAVKDGIIFSTVVQNPYKFGYQSMRILGALARSEDPGIPESQVFYIPERVINKDNVDAFWAKLRELKGER